MKIKKLAIIMTFLGSVTLTKAMQTDIRNNIERTEDAASGVIEYRDLSTNFWAKFDPNVNSFSGRSNIWHGTFQEDRPGEWIRMEPNQDESRNFYNRLKERYNAVEKG